MWARALHPGVPSLWLADASDVDAAMERDDVRPIAHTVKVAHETGAIGSRVGHSDPNALSRLIERETNASPRELRRRRRTLAPDAQSVRASHAKGQLGCPEGARHAPIERHGRLVEMIMPL